MAIFSWSCSEVYKELDDLQRLILLDVFSVSLFYLVIWEVFTLYCSTESTIDSLILLSAGIPRARRLPLMAQ